LPGWERDKREAADKTPHVIKKDSLELHRWYRVSARIGWDWQSLAWSPVGKRGIMPAGVPLYVTERRGNVAVLRGACHGVILVPDGESVQWFRPIGHGEIGENVGDLPPPDLPPAPDGEFSRFGERSTLEQAARLVSTGERGSIPCRRSECQVVFVAAPIRDKEPSPVQPEFADLAGECVWGTVTQDGRKIAIKGRETDVGTWDASGELRADGTIYLAWIELESGTLAAGVYRLTERTLDGQWNFLGEFQHLETLPLHPTGEMPFGDDPGD
jgi:hypothetical protein